MSEIDIELQKARPKLSEVVPLTAAICWGYAVINILLGLGMFFIYQGTIAPIAIASILNYQQWGVVYFTLGAVTAYGLISNRWSITRNSQVFGLIVKAIWLLALIVRCTDYPQTIIITLVWAFFAFIQAMVYIHFIPQATRELENEGS